MFSLLRQWMYVFSIVYISCSHIFECADCSHTSPEFSTLRKLRWNYWGTSRWLWYVWVGFVSSLHFPAIIAFDIYIDSECESTQELLYRPTNLSLCDNSPRGRIRSRQIRIPLHDGSAQKSEDAQSSTTVDGSLLSPTKALTTSFLGASQPPLQHERKIRNVDLITFWFVSRGPGPIEEPLRSGVRFTDLYLHLHGESEVQVWIWNSNNVWETVEQGYVHPQLPDRRLWLASRDEPSWITRKTARTYKGKAQAVWVPVCLQLICMCTVVLNLESLMITTIWLR